MDDVKIMEQLNHADQKARLEGLENWIQNHVSGSVDHEFVDVNNHIHTWYSFSPYSPTKAVMMAVKAGLATAGIMDHDSVAGVQEFLQAGQIAGLPVTCGMELRVSMKNTGLVGKRINNPDQIDVAYMAIHGIPHNRLQNVAEFCKPIFEQREIRNRKMIRRINEITGVYIGEMDYDKDVLPLSKAHEGGSVTERHLLFALAGKMMSVFGKGPKVTAFLQDQMELYLSNKNVAFLDDPDNLYYQYDLLGTLKSGLVERFYIPANDIECPDVKEVLGFVDEIGAVSAYAYLGDVKDSVTGDKKAQTFEDGYLNELFSELKRLGFHAVTYMPSRNTLQQLQRVKILCNTFGLAEISGEDINSPRQKFICTALRDEKFQNLIRSTYALIQHEYMATLDKSLSLFSKESISKVPDLKKRVDQYAQQFLDRRSST
ncbi:MAG TPA: PHP domain-containing protein [Clostridiales bacterium]|nr:PHP domain-containing protein [Clostridiales bacterium]